MSLLFTTLITERIVLKLQVLLVFLVTLSCYSEIKAQVPNLGASSGFALFTASGAFNNVGASTLVTGDVGTNVGAFNAFPPGVLVGQAHVADPLTAQAATDVDVAYGYLAGLTCGSVIATTLGGGQMLLPNIYCMGAASTLSGDLTLDGQGDPSSIFIFQIDGALSTSTFSNVILTNGASLCNVYWQINGAFALGDSSVFRGNLLVNGAINLLEGSSLFGRGLSRAGAINLHNNIVTIGLPPVAPVIIASGTSSFCQGDSVTLSGNIDGTWNNGLTTPSITVKFSGDYYVVNANSCGMDTSNHIIVTAYDKPYAPQLIPIPNLPAVCEGSTLSVSFVSPGNGGSGTCTDEYRYSTDNGVIWSNWGGVLPTFIALEGTNIVQARRICVPNNCESEYSQVSWLVNSNPSASIIPFPAEVCILTDLQLNGNPSGGSGSYTTHSWSGPGSVHLNYTAIVNPIFNHSMSGSFSLSYEVTDSNGCKGSGFTVVEVGTDNIPPSITCPDNITLQLDPLQCEGLAIFSSPESTDNCSGVTMTLLTPLGSESFFPLGINTVTYQATDASNNTSTCSFTVTVIEYQAPPLGCKNVNLSLDGNCAGILTPTAVLTGWEGPTGEILLGCEDQYIISVTGKNGQNLGYVLGINELGKTLKYTITHPNGFICWGDVTVEDKIKPTITCRDIEVHCLTDLKNVAPPIVSDNCSAKAVLVNEVHEALQCDAQYIGKVVRTWKAVDNAGNESAVCTSTIYLLRSSAAGITAPPVNVTLRCSDNYRRDSQGYPHPGVTGIPTFDGKPLYPVSQLDMIYCNSTIDYNDNLIVDTKCKKRIIRNWSITEWWCSTANTIFMGMQIIDIIDDIAPVIPQQVSVTLTTQTRSCSALVQLPKLNITDNCNAVYRVYINASQNGLPTGYINNNGGTLELGVGGHTITYTAIDECGNTSTMSYRVTVRDETDPIAICHQYATVSLKTNGYTEITADAVDDGSFDECGAVTLKIRRMEDPCNFGADTAWYDKVGFCCMDAGRSRMVQLLVTDQGGNTNICMVSVNVQDKVTPTITCPADLTISDCTFTFDPSRADSYFGAAVIEDNCPANNTIIQSLVDNRNQCGIGTIVRTFRVTQGPVVFQTCTQTITFENNDPFYINGENAQDPNDDIVWPKDYLALGQCSFAGLLPEALPDSSSYPKITEDACDLVGVRYEDLVFPFTTNGACYKIIRTWTVIDWCQRDEFGNARTWHYDQEIKVMDRDAPVITSSTAPRLTLTYDAQCSEGAITLTASATDCTPAAELRWTYVITNGGVTVKTGTGNNASGSYAIGVYYITFRVEDKCGNLTETGYSFEIRNAKAPTAICKQGLASPLVLMDTNGDGIGDTPMTMLSPEFFDNKSGHPCGYAVQLSFSADVNDRTRIYDCTKTGNQPIQLWVTDTNGNTSYCSTYVDIQPNGLCPTPPGITVKVSGRTYKENNEDIEDVTVELKGSEKNPVLTDRSGLYAFEPMVTGGAYQVIPSKEGDYINGVSTLDLVLIQRHIIGIERLDSPYKIMAADANNNGAVTASDLTEIRKMILGLTPKLSNNSSWRFVDAGYTFVNKEDPWQTPVEEIYNIDPLNNDMKINFIGIKVGDVNGNAKGSNAKDTETEIRNTYRLGIADRQVSKGEVIEIAVTAEGGHTLYGIQNQWSANGLAFRAIRDGALHLRGEEYVIKGGQSIAMSYVSAAGVTVRGSEILYVIEAVALRDGMLSEMLHIGAQLSPEAYLSGMETRNLAVTYGTGTEKSFAMTGVTPNPWNTNTTISFEMPKDGKVQISILDYTGRKLMTTTDRYQAGTNAIQISKSDIGQPGVYVYELRYEDKVITGKMILIE